tara:strand:+ start:161 stop:394 length:234 start_codon:yes stop_codon:yes gene_type:complete
MKSINKKKFYNRVRRTCKLHDIEIRYRGAPKNWRSVELVKEDKVMFSDRAEDYEPLDIDWERLHNELKQCGWTGGIR